MASQSSHTNSRQFGGMMPSRKAFAIMPRCLRSERNTWQRRHNTRRLDNSLPASLPDLMWSMWHSRSVTEIPQRTQIPPSRPQTLRRVSRHISNGCRDHVAHLPFLSRYNGKVLNAYHGHACSRSWPSVIDTQDFTSNCQLQSKTAIDLERLYSTTKRGNCQDKYEVNNG